MYHLQIDNSNYFSNNINNIYSYLYSYLKNIENNLDIKPYDIIDLGLFKNNIECTDYKKINIELVNEIKKKYNTFDERSQKISELFNEDNELSFKKEGTNGYIIKHCGLNNYDFDDYYKKLIYFIYVLNICDEKENLIIKSNYTNIIFFYLQYIGNHNKNNCLKKIKLSYYNIENEEKNSPVLLTSDSLIWIEEKNNYCFEYFFTDEN